jgi:DNA-binding Lrp family transcriptional regulator
MMTILMIDVEAGKEDLFEQLHPKLNEIKLSKKLDDIQVLYLARCYTHEDISVMIDVKDSEKLPEFIIDNILGLDGVWDLRTIHLFNPNFFRIPNIIEKGDYERFTVTLDVRSDKTKSVFNYLQKFAATQEAAISFLAYTFYSYDNDIILTLLAKDIVQAGKFVEEKIRPIDGVIDTVIWQTKKWDFIISKPEWLSYVNYHRKENFDEDEFWDDSYICAC